MPATAGSPNTWNGLMAAAKAAGAKFPELVAAQWALESGWGKHTSGKNNFFGLKGSGTKTTTQEVVNGQTITINAEFLDFPTLDACVKYLVDRWYQDWKGYKGVNHAETRDDAAKALVGQGYATDPDYTEKLIKIMNEKSPEKPVQALDKPICHIEATQNTWLKKKAIDSAKLAENEKKGVHAGKTYAVIAYKELAADAHAEVELDHKAGTWFIYEPHWQKMQVTGEAMPAQVDWNDFSCLVTPNLTVGEIMQWDKRRIPGPNSSARSRLLNTAKQFQAVREGWKAPLGVTSFYRPEPINSQVGGVPNSRHTTGEAFDIYPANGSLESFYQWIRCRWTGGLGDGRHRGFIHLDTRNGGGFVPGAGVRPVVEWTY